MALTVGSLFSGIGGIDLGLERASMVTRWFCEIDPHCRNVLARHWPGLPIYGDITAVDWSGVEPVDVLAGGFPCQPVSNAGLRRGTDDDRWLWPEFARAIRALRPRYVLVENVAALLGRGFEHVITDLAALGYDAEWDCIPAAAVGAPHLRNRVWTVAYARGARRWEVAGGPSGDEGSDARRSALHDHESRGHGSRRNVADTDRRGRRQGRQSSDGRTVGARRADPDNAPTSTDSGALADSPSLGRREGRPESAREQGRPRAAVSRAVFSDANGEPLGRIAESRGQRGQWATEPDVGRVAHGVPHRVDRLRALGNAVVPQVVEWIGRRIVAFDEEVKAA